VYKSGIDVINIIDSKHSNCYGGGNLKSSSYYTDAVQNSIHIIGEITAAENIPLLSFERNPMKRERERHGHRSVETPMLGRENYTTYLVWKI